MHRRLFLYGAAAGLGAWPLLRLGAARAGEITTDAIGDKIQTLPRGQLPEFARTRDVQRLYRFAVERGDELQYMPCFCGCHQFGHLSNRDCYIKSFNSDGTLTFTSHAAT